MRRVMSMPEATIAALVMLAGFDLAARSAEQAQLSKYYEAAPLGCAYAIVRPFIVIPYFLSGMVSGVSLESTTKTANRLAGSLSLAFSLIL